MSRQVRSIDLLKVVNSNDITTSLVEVPCSAKQSGFKKQSWKAGWVKRILYNMRKKKEKEFLVAVPNKEKEFLVAAPDGDEYDDK
jgi:hypothetical protein